MSHGTLRQTSLSSLIGSAVLLPDGTRGGRVSEAVLDATQTGTHVGSLILSPSGKINDEAAVTVPLCAFDFETDGTIRLHDNSAMQPHVHTESAVLLERDLLDQQIIDINGTKVVRVNDVDLVWEPSVGGSECRLRIAEVEVGMRGAVRRLLRGLPPGWVESLAHRFQPRVIPWEFVDLIDRDPARRVRLKIEHDRLSSMHPSDIADILEDLAPAEREAVFTSLNEEIAAEALEEIDPKLQRSLLESLPDSHAADIVEEMDPGAAADLLSELSDERSEAILHEMEPEERKEVEDLLEFPEDWAAGRMTTDYISVDETGDVAAALEALRSFDGDVETIGEIFLENAQGYLTGVVSVSRIALAAAATPLEQLGERRVRYCNVDSGSGEVAELFDKYNLRALAVLDADRKLSGVIYAEHVIALLRESH